MTGMDTGGAGESEAAGDNSFFRPALRRYRCTGAGGFRFFLGPPFGGTRERRLQGVSCKVLGAGRETGFGASVGNA